MKNKQRKTTIKMWILTIYILSIVQTMTFLCVKEIAKQQEIIKEQITNLEGGTEHE